MSCRNRIRYIHNILEQTKQLEIADLDYLIQLILEHKTKLILDKELDNSNGPEERNDTTKK